MLTHNCCHACIKLQKHVADTEIRLKQVDRFGRHPPVSKEYKVSEHAHTHTHTHTHTQTQTHAHTHSHIHTHAHTHTHTHTCTHTYTHVRAQDSVVAVLKHEALNELTASYLVTALGSTGEEWNDCCSM